MKKFRSMITYFLVCTMLFFIAMPITAIAVETEPAVGVLEPTIAGEDETVTPDIEEEGTPEGMLPPDVGEGETPVEGSAILETRSNGSQLTDWTYREQNGSVILEKYNGSATDIVVPGRLDGKPVVLDASKTDLFPLTSISLTIGDARDKVTLLSDTINAFGTLKNLINGNFSGLSHSFSSIGFLKQMRNVETLDLRGWDVSSIKSFATVFGSQYTSPGWSGPLDKLRSVDLSGWDVSGASNFMQMFMNCTSLERIDLSSWADKMTNAETLIAMFQNCTSLKEANLAGWNLPNVRMAGSFVAGCTNLETLNLTGWNFVTNGSANLFEMFMDCHSLEELDLRGWDLSRVAILNRMFANCYKLKKLNLTGTVMGKYGGLRARTLQMFMNCYSLTELDLSGWDTSEWTSMNAMFYENHSLETLKLGPGWDTGNVTNMGGMFKNAHKLKNLDVAGWNTSSVTNMHRMFMGANSLESLDLSKWNTSKVTIMYSMFNGCTELKNLNVANWDTDQVETMFEMFASCPSLQFLDLSSFRTDSIKTFDEGPYKGYGLEGLFNLPVDANISSMIVATDRKIIDEQSAPPGRAGGGIIYHAKGGTFAGSGTKSFFEDKITFSSRAELQTSDKAIFEKYTPSKAGDTFVGWFLDEDCTQKFIYDPADPQPIDLTSPKWANKVLYAGWKEEMKTFQVSFSAGKNGTMEPEVYSETVRIGKRVSKVPAITASPGYSFMGWTLPGEDTRYSNEDVLNKSITKAMTFTAAYQKDNTGGGGGGGGGGSAPTTYYTLEYVSNGSKIADERHGANTTVQLTKIPTWSGYEFLGWYKDTALIDKVTSVKMTGNKTVYAKWQPEPATIFGILNRDDHFAYIQGYADGLVRPAASITRAEVATIFFNLLKEEVRSKNLTESNGFTDVKAGDWHNRAISTMAKLGIVNGRGGGIFDPDAFITRAEFAAIAARFDTVPYTGADRFPDIGHSWARDAINQVSARGWVKGDKAGNFHPDVSITRAEAMTVINRILGRQPQSADDLLPGMKIWPDNMDTTAWYYLVVQEATNSHDHVRKSDNIHESWKKLTQTPR